MWLARYFPGLHFSVRDVDQLTPEEAGALHRVGLKLLKGEAEERFAHTRAIAMAAGLRLR
jgi:hypothetical protein